jgi:hypothetical protein
MGTELFQRCVSALTNGLDTDYLDANFMKYQLLNDFFGECHDSLHIYYLWDDDEVADLVKFKGREFVKDLLNNAGRTEDEIYYFADAENDVFKKADIPSLYDYYKEEIVFRIVLFPSFSEYETWYSAYIREVLIEGLGVRREMF